MDCFICNGPSYPHTGQGVFIEGATAKFTGCDITTVINQLVGDAFFVVIDQKDSICINCIALVGELDRFRYESTILEKILKRQINRKYKLDDFTKLLEDIDAIALLSFNVRLNGRHECKECAHAVQHLDEIAAHYKYHQLTKEQANSIVILPKPEACDPECLESMELENESNEVSVVDGSLVDEETKLSDLDIFDEQDYSNLIVEDDQSDSNVVDRYSADNKADQEQLNYLECLMNEPIPLTDEEYGADNVNSSHEAPDQSRLTPRPYKYSCTKCPYITKLRKCLMSHYTQKHGQTEQAIEKKFTCEKCDAKFEHIFQIENHIKDNHLLCRVCQEQFTSSLELRTHIKDIHNKYQYECKYCGKFWRSCSNRDTHEIATHTRKYRHHCSYCNKGFSVACTMRLHIAAKHTNKPNHICDQCGRSFIYNYDYKIHKMLHANSKPFKCKLCEEIFRTPSMRGKHTREVHTKEPLHTCEYCGLDFFQKGKYQLHLISKHTHDFVHKCPLCVCRGFLRKRELARHLSVRHRDSSMLKSMDAAHDHRMANLKIVVTRSKKYEECNECVNDSCDDYE